MLSLFSDITGKLGLILMILKHEIVLGQHNGNLEEEARRSTSDLNHIDTLGRTLLSWASYCGDLAAATKLLQLGANLNIGDEVLRPLPSAISGSHVSCALQLIEYGAEMFESVDSSPIMSIA